MYSLDNNYLQIILNLYLTRIKCQVLDMLYMYIV